MSAEFVELTATEAAGKIARGEISSEDYTRALIAQVDSIENKVGAFAHFDPEFALAQARERDEYRANGNALGPLHGVPVAIKDCIDTADLPTENGSALFADRRPYKDATVVTKLRAAGAVIFGKTVTTEFAFFHPGKTKNPHDLERTPGGSSSGSAAAVAAGMVPLSVGTQTNGSIIRPAAYCGVFGMKPSHGLVSRAGVFSHSPTLDHVGPFARSLDDVALILDAIAGYDEEDPDTKPYGVPNFLSGIREKPPVAPKLAYVRTPAWSKADKATAEAFEELADSLGDMVQRVELHEPVYSHAWDDLRAIMTADMAHRHGKIVTRGGDVASQTLRDFLAEGRRVPATRYLEALAQAKQYARSLSDFFEYYDAILTPAATGVAPKGLGSTGDPVFCSLWTLTGLPAVSLPLLQGENGLPLGVQLVGPMNRDARLLRTAKWLLAHLAHGEAAEVA
ncbi:MAG TPA: amidase [Xanthobacteraceae bacterium]|nr:amidase [Xanthobacteraceae bacterium]